MVHSEIGLIKRSPENTGPTYKKGRQQKERGYKATQADTGGNLILLEKQKPHSWEGIQEFGGQVNSLGTGISPPRDAEGNVIRRHHTDPPF